ncbi:MAG: hypothetical protein GF383_02405 [Candidatus Lokiarchaeota archaeon]|nr:hypothetical protein [Candidatus Lokiarchaeota archaeon]MBD3338264.1 hypothetical protein [Candidatus Lokiarchaeota archaeon]
MIGRISYLIATLQRSFQFFMDEWICDSPQLISKDYREKYTSACEKYKESGQIWYKGMGIPIENHPLKDYIWFKGCGNCESNEVKIIAAQWSVHPMSGDRYWDYEIFCENCGKYTQRAFAEND